MHLRFICGELTLSVDVVRQSADGRKQTRNQGEQQSTTKEHRVSAANGGLICVIYVLGSCGLAFEM